jgi:hypothetical protein
LLDQSRATRESDPPATAFVDETEDDDLATQLAHDFVQSATSAEDGDVDLGDELIRDEPLVPDGDDDDLAFEPEELMFPTPKPRPMPTPQAPGPARKRAKVAKPTAAKSKAKAAASASAKAKPKGKAKAKPKAVKPKAVKAKPAKSAPARKKATKKKAAGKAAKRRR